jgi:azurin
MKLAAIALVSTLFAGVAFGKTCEVTVEGSDAMSYNTKTIATAGCKDVKLTLKHSGKLPKAAMGHNIVITTDADMKKTIDAATKAGPAKDYSPGVAGVIVATKLLGGGESDTVTFSTDKLKKGTKYKFFCTFPGHSALMQGDVTL